MMRQIALVIACMLAASFAHAGTVFAEWDISADDDPAAIEYAIYVGGGVPGDCTPNYKVWQGRNAVAGARMGQSFTFEQTTLPTTIERLCAAVTAVNVVTQRESAQSSPASVDGDFRPPPPAAPTGLRLNYQP